jgi:hypothetical protein
MMQYQEGSNMTINIPLNHSERRFWCKTSPLIGYHTFPQDNNNLSPTSSRPS